MVRFICLVCCVRLHTINLGFFTLCSRYDDECVAMSCIRMNLGRNSGNPGSPISSLFFHLIHDQSG